MKNWTAHDIFWDSNLLQCLQIWGIAIFFEGIPRTCARDKKKTGVWRGRGAAPKVGPKKGEPWNDTLTTKRKYNILKVHSTLHTFAPTFLMGHGWVVLRPNYAFKITSYLFSSSLSTLLKQNSDRIYQILLTCLIDSYRGVALIINIMKKDVLGRWYAQTLIAFSCVSWVEVTWIKSCWT